jgi:replicative DNA helicase
VERILVGDSSSFIPTNFPSMDRLLGGLERSNLEIIAARPSMGKTSLLIKWILNIAKQGVPCEIISYEMSVQQLTRRAIAMESGVGTQKLNRGTLKEDEKKAVRKAVHSLEGLPLSIAYTTFSNVTDLINHIRMAHKSKGIEVVGIDYAQLIPVTEGRETQDYARIATALKQIAKELNIVIVLLSQLNRDVERRRNKRPILSDIRQSGGFEENADRVFFVYREYRYVPKEENRGLAEIIVAKNRNGPLGVFHVMFDDECTNFYELD